MFIGRNRPGDDRGELHVKDRLGDCGTRAIVFGIIPALGKAAAQWGWNATGPGQKTAVLPRLSPPRQLMDLRTTALADVNRPR